MSKKRAKLPEKQVNITNRTRFYRMTLRHKRILPAGQLHLNDPPTSQTQYTYILNSPSLDKQIHVSSPTEDIFPVAILNSSRSRLTTPPFGKLPQPLAKSTPSVIMCISSFYSYATSVQVINNLF